MDALWKRFPELGQLFQEYPILKTLIVGSIVFAFVLMFICGIFHRGPSNPKAAAKKKS